VALMFRVLSLFAGIGGFDLGLERTGGFRTVAFCEIDPRARKVLSKHWPEVPCYDDVRELTAERLAADGISVDVICGGFPCQDISAAGPRAGLFGDRSSLFFEIDRLVGELRPGVVILENSPELLDGWMGVVLGALAGRGLHAEWEVIPAALLGAPHLRERVWIVAYSPEVSGIHELHLGDAVRRGLPNAGNPWASSAWDSPEAGTCRVDDGIPGRVDRTGECGNAVVPQIPELIGRAILASRNEREMAA
jgi:DNA (cytosine-5)-methyltransferase 1